MSPIGILLLTGCVAAATANVGLFMAQRTALLVCRSEGLPIELKAHFFPPWLLYSIWPVKLGRWVLLLGVVALFGWKPAAGLWLAEFALTPVLPIPHRAVLTLFHAHLSSLTEDDPRKALLGPLLSACPRLIRSPHL